MAKCDANNFEAHTQDTFLLFGEYIRQRKASIGGRRREGVVFICVSVCPHRFRVFSASVRLFMPVGTSFLSLLSASVCLNVFALVSACVRRCEGKS